MEGFASHACYVCVVAESGIGVIWLTTVSAWRSLVRDPQP
jgi:hypothetical protein